MKPTLTLLLLTISALGLVGTAFEEYAFTCRIVILLCIVTIVAVKLFQVNDEE